MIQQEKNILLKQTIYCILYCIFDIQNNAF